MTFFYLHTLPQFEPEMKNDVTQLQLFSQTLQIYPLENISCVNGGVIWLHPVIARQTLFKLTKSKSWRKRRDFARIWLLACDKVVWRQFLRFWRRTKFDEIRKIVGGRNAIEDRCRIFASGKHPSRKFASKSSMPDFIEPKKKINVSWRSLKNGGIQILDGKYRREPNKSGGGTQSFSIPPSAYVVQENFLVAVADYNLGGYNRRHHDDFWISI